MNAKELIEHLNKLSEAQEIGIAVWDGNRFKTCPINSLNVIWHSAFVCGKEGDDSIPIPTQDVPAYIMAKFKNL